MNSTPEFILFGKQHISVLLVIVGVGFTLWPGSRWVVQKGWTRPVAITLALLSITELFIKTIGYSAYGVPWNRLLPLQICDINAVLCAYMLIKRHYGAYEIAYFWALAASTAAMLTPDLQYGFPHPIFGFFFLGHAFSVFGVLYATFAYGFQPRLRSIGVAMAATVLYGCVMLLVNYLLGTNFLYLRAKPVMPSLLDFMGPWPWYIVGLVGLCVIACFLVYTPFLIMRRWHTK